MANLEAKVISAVLNDKQFNVLMQADALSLMVTHGDIYEFVQSYYEQNNSMPPVALVQSKFPDFEYSEDTGSTKYHVEELKNAFLDDSMRTVLRSTAQLLQDGNPRGALDEITTQGPRLMRLTSTVRDLDVMDTDATIDYFENIQRLQALGQYGIYTGLKGFDDYLPSGITPGMFGVFLAYPAIGKSWMMLYFAVQAWKRGKSPLIISLEMTEEEVRTRLLVILGEGMWSHKNLSAGKVELDMMRKWSAQIFEGKPPIHIISNEGIGEISPAIIAGKIDQYAPDIVFVDYLNLMAPNGGGASDNETVRMKKLSREMKLLATSKHTPVVAISSATPDDSTDITQVPQLFQVAWSKQLAYDTDWLIAFGRAQTSDVIECVYRKNRNGVCGDFLVQVDFDKGRFRYKDFV